MAHKEIAMIKLNGLLDDELELISRQVADAFYDYPYPAESRGLRAFLPERDQMLTYINGIIRAGYRGGLLYATSEKREGYLMMTSSKGDTIRFPDGIRMILAMKTALGGWKKQIEFTRAFLRNGGTFELRMRKGKRDYVKVDLLAVQAEYQKQGFMKRMLEFAFNQARERGVPVILETDDQDKCERYMHYGMKVDRIRDVVAGVRVYDLIWEGNR